jgi:AcrR family transcriptional regulator
MSSVADKSKSGSPRTARRRHDAQASRRALLDAATALFDERGYHATTVREIGERAGVDAALIARYFGGKEGLYLAAVSEAPGPAPTADPLELIARILRKSDAHGLGPVALAMVSPTLTDAMRDQVSDIIATRSVGPLAEALQERGVTDPHLRAELLVATALGVSLTRAAGGLPAVRDAAPDQLLEVLRPAADVLCPQDA